LAAAIMPKVHKMIAEKVGAKPMAMIKAYFDDSQTSGRVWAVGGYGGQTFQWEGFEEKWASIFIKHGVPYFHMSEFGNPNGVTPSGGLLRSTWTRRENLSKILPLLYANVG
jgi:hypothetical protein